MTTPKDTLQDILSKLDITDDANWTEDGAPALDVVQKLANDEALTREDINAAEPGFIRQIGEKAPGGKKVKSLVKAERETPSPEPVNDYTPDRMRAILNRRVDEAEAALIAAQTTAAEAVKEVARCQARLGRSVDDRSKQFPPITPAQAIKDHLASQQRQRQIAYGVNPDAPHLSPIEDAMSRKPRGHGQGRPTRPVMDGRLIVAKTA